MKLRELICIIFSLFSLVTVSYAQGESAATSPQIKWLSFDEVEALLKTEKKKLIVDIYREGCGWCRKMEEETFQDDIIVDYINRHYYAVKMDAAQKESITFQGETYGFVNSGKHGHHELAMKITQGEQGLPSVVFLDENVDVIQSFTGYQSPDDFEKVMTYFGEDHHFKTPWIRYEAIYEPRNKTRNKLQINTLAAPAPSSN